MYTMRFGSFMSDLDEAALRDAATFGDLDELKEDLMDNISS